MSPVVIGRSISLEAQRRMTPRSLTGLEMMTHWHEVCTCKMDVPSDPLAVVNSKTQRMERIGYELLNILDMLLKDRRL